MENHNRGKMNHAKFENARSINKRIGIRSAIEEIDQMSPGALPEDARRRLFDVMTYHTLAAEGWQKEAEAYKELVVEDDLKTEFNRVNEENETVKAIKQLSSTLGSLQGVLTKLSFKAEDPYSKSRK